MAIEQKLSAGSECSVTSIASGNNSKCVLDESSETTANVSDVVLKVRKPYTMSKQREKWTEEEHQKFIEAVKMYGRTWRQIEEYIGTKTAVQIRSHAQKFFSKVMKEGACNAEASTEPIEIPPPRPKRKPLHPYPRKLVETPNKTKQCPGSSSNMKTSERDAHSPISALSSEVSRISNSQAKKQGSGVSRTSSGSNLSHDDEMNKLAIDNSSQGMKKENEENLSLTFNSCGPLLDNSYSMKAGKNVKGTESVKDEDNYLENRIKCDEEGPSMKSIKLFGHTFAVTNRPQYSVHINNMVMHPATHDKVTVLASKISNQLVSEGISMGQRPSKNEGSNGFFCTGSICNSLNDRNNAKTNLDSVDSKIAYIQQAYVNPNDFKGLYPYKRCVSGREAVYTADERESQRIRVYL